MLCSVSLQVNFVCSFVYVSRTISFIVIFFDKVDFEAYEILVEETNRGGKFSKGGQPRTKLCFLKSDEQFYSFFQQIPR